jgi:MFS family permease
MYGLGALPAGYISDKVNLRYMLAAGAAGIGICSIIAGFSESKYMLAAVLTFTGLFMSVYHPAGMSLLSGSMKDKRGRAMGLNGVMGNIGIAFGPILFSLCYYLAGWRSAFQILGIVSVFFGLSALFVKSIPAQISGNPSRPKDDKKHLLYFIIVMIIIMFAGILYRMNTITIPAFIENFGPKIAKGMSGLKYNPLENLAANFFVFLIYICGAAGQWAGGHFADKHDLRKIYLYFYFFILPLLILIYFSKGITAVILSSLLITFLLGLQPVENSLIARLTPAGLRGAAYGFKFIIGFGIGSIAVKITSMIQKEHSIAEVFLSAAAISLIIIALVTGLLFISRKSEIRNN